MFYLSTSEIREKFIEYFTKNNHEYFPASSLIPSNDSSILFVNSGMVQFKDLFTNSQSKYHGNIVSCQKCIRAGGKHNDLENVGYTTRHHTFFEMLGNFSFGGYFKEEAIYLAWNMLTKEFCIPKNKLYITVYHSDDEALLIWKKISGFSSDRIVRINSVDNFWSMGDIGPCGPSSEIFYDHGDILPGTIHDNGERFVEIWNIVFMELDQINNNKVKLNNKSIDTGLGLERLAAVMQGTHDNYQTDIFKELIYSAESILKIKAFNQFKLSYKVIVDHLRSSAFLISDGIMPSNEGRGYVLRRIIRRAVRHGHLLGVKEPFFYKLLPKLVDLMSVTYPELDLRRNLISEVLKQEEILFKNTLDRGLLILEQEIKDLSPNSLLPGDTAFKLYDTYGFPLDLTSEILKGKNITINVEEFNNRMQEQKLESKRHLLDHMGDLINQKIWRELHIDKTEFLGYSTTKSDGLVLALIYNQKIVNNISIEDIGNKSFFLITNHTPFYGESGGQKGDIGIIISQQARIKVIDTKKFLKSIVAHFCILLEGLIQVGDTVNLIVDEHYRKNLTIHHSATHILHAVIRNYLGDSVFQHGSLISSNYLRLDFNYYKALSLDDVSFIEDKVNEIISNDLKVSINLMSKDQAIASGAIALFDEKYEAEVRVIKIENVTRENPLSLELCGGTHVSRTSEIGIFKIINELSVASGIRRIEAVCGENAIKLIRKNDFWVKELSNILKAPSTAIISRVQNLIQENSNLLKEIERLNKKILDISIEQIEKDSLNIGSVKLIYKIVEGFNSHLIRSITKKISLKGSNFIVVYISNIKKSLSITVSVSKKISDSFSAVFIAKKLSEFLGGKSGGGNTTLAQFNGVYLAEQREVQDELVNIVSKIMSDSKY